MVFPSKSLSLTTRESDYPCMPRHNINGISIALDRYLIYIGIIVLVLENLARNYALLLW